MSKPAKSEECYAKWVSLIKADKISEVLTLSKRSTITGEKALECIVYISNLAFKDAQKGIPFSSSPGDIVHLTKLLCSSVNSQPSLCSVRYITSLYHITYFFFKKNNLEYLIKLFEIVVDAKQANNKAFENDGKLPDNFSSLLRQTISNLVSNRTTTTDQSKLSELFALLLDLMVIDETLENGAVFLRTVAYASQTVGKEDHKLAIKLATNGLFLFYKVKRIKDIDASLQMMFKLYINLFINQFAITGYCTALYLVESHVNEIKWKFSENIHHGYCFLMLCHTVKIITWNGSETSSVKNKIQKNNEILKEFQENKDVSLVKNTCMLMIHLTTNSYRTQKQISSVLIQSCLEPLLEMFLNIYSILKDPDIDKSYLLQCVSDGFVLTSQVRGAENRELLKQCLPLLVKAEIIVLDLIHSMRSEGHSKADHFTKFVLVRFANLIRTYHIADLPEELIILSKPVCKFICTLPPSLLDEDHTQQALDLIFSFTVNALSLTQLQKALEILVVWMFKCPQCVKKIFKHWGDLKHNTVCHGGSEYLENTVLTLVTEGKSRIEEEWLPCQWATAELGNLLVEELKSYFVNKTLRGEPVIAAAEALQTLDTDCLTQAQGLVIALNVASATDKFPEKCLFYYNKSKYIFNKLRKEKKNFDPVDFSICLGNLLYAQLRCQLKFLRTDCESEMLRLSAGPHEPLIPELPENQPDPNDTCDVATSYSSLSLANQRKILDIMDSALIHWGVSHAKMLESESTDYDLLVTLESLEEAAFLLKLYCDEIREAKVWNLLYNMAVLANNPDKIVIAVGGMLNSTNNIDQAIVDKAKLQLTRPDLSEKTKLSFSLNRALYCLNKNKIVQGFEFLENMETETKKHHILYIEYHMIVGSYQNLKNWADYNKTFSSSSSYHCGYHKALSFLLFLLKESKWASFKEASWIQLNLLRVSYQLGESNWILEQPREARCYLKSQLPLAQKLALPLRVIQLLLVLAWVDLRTGVKDDCTVKLEGLEDLLELKGTSDLYGLIHNKDGGSTSPGPYLNKREMVKPEYLSHKPACSCLACTCVEYRRLVLETLTLRGVFCANFGQLDQALQCFKVALQVEENLESEADNSEVRLSCARMWMQYADVLALSKSYQEGLVANKRAFVYLHSIREPNTFQQALHQKICLQNSTVGPQYKRTTPRIVIGCEETTANSLKTPEVGKEVMSIPAKTPLSIQNGNITPKIVRPVRRLILPSSGEENTPPSIPKSKQRTRVRPKFVSDKTPHTVKKKSAATPFVVFGDDENSVDASGSNVPSTIKKKTKSKTVEGDKFAKKKLFDSKTTSVKTDTAAVFIEPDEIVRKSNRNIGIRKYGTTIVNGNDAVKNGKFGTSQNTKQKEIKTDQDSNVFSFDSLTHEVHKINSAKSTVPKSTYSRGSSSLIMTKKCSKSNQEMKNKTEIEVTNKVDSENASDCSVVEGTPPETQKKPLQILRPRRAKQRSNNI